MDPIQTLDDSKLDIKWFDVCSYIGTVSSFNLFPAALQFVIRFLMFQNLKDHCF